MKKTTHIVRQAERLKRGEINRRRFIMAALATGVTLPTATSLAQRAEAAPKAGGVLRFGVADAKRLGDITALATGSTLLEVGDDGALTGDLAASFEQAPGGAKWVFRLRPEAVFNDGTTLDAHAVVASLSSTQTPGLRGQVATVRADGPATVIFDLVHPNPDFAWVLSDPALSVRTPSGVGSGAYVATDERHLGRVTDHWKTGRGHFDALDLIALPDPAARLTALLNGEIDLIDDVDPRMFALLARTPEIKLIEAAHASVYGLARQTGTDVGIGRAINDVTDRRDLARKVLLGHGKPYDCASCRDHTLLKETITLGDADAPFPGSKDMLALIKQSASHKGVSVSVGEAETPQFKAERLRLRPTLDWTLAEALARRPDALLEEFVIRARRAPSAQERAVLHKTALRHLETRGDVLALLANEIHAHAAHLTMPDGAFDAHRIGERGWFA